jgi:glycosyltransferase involved in cell wall biosynthesis
MKILYHIATLRPTTPEVEAVSQEVATLQAAFGGSPIYVNPNQRSPVYIPRLLFGFHKLREIRGHEAELHHFFNPDPFPFPYLRALRRPVVYSLTCGLRQEKVNRKFLSRMSVVTVSDERSLDHLKSQGLTNLSLVQPGIDKARFTPTPLTLDSEIRLMVGSAPWVRSQFKSKGVDALLEVAQRMPRLNLVFLWRGVLSREMKHRVHLMGLEDQVEVLDRVVDVNEVLAGMHASVTLAEEPDIVKAYPHSLLESLAAGKPVLVSRAIPMADYVAQTASGLVVAAVTPDHVVTALKKLELNYAELQRAAAEVAQRDFSQQEMINSYGRVYQDILAPTR